MAGHARFVTHAPKDSRMMRSARCTNGGPRSPNAPTSSLVRPNGERFQFGRLPGEWLSIVMRQRRVEVPEASLRRSEADISLYAGRFENVRRANLDAGAAVPPWGDGIAEICDGRVSRRSILVIIRAQTRRAKFGQIVVASGSWHHAQALHCHAGYRSAASVDAAVVLYNQNDVWTVSLVGKWETREHYLSLPFVLLPETWSPRHPLMTSADFDVICGMSAGFR